MSLDLRDNVVPFSLLLEIDARARRGRQGSEVDLRTQAHWTGVGFSVLDQRLVAPMGTVTEILKVPPLTRLPRVQPWVEGIANVRGRLLPVIGLAAFLGGDQAPAWRERRVLVLASDAFDCALLVDEVHGLKHFTVESFTEQVDMDPLLAPYVEGIYHGAEGKWGVFRPDLLLGDKRFLDAAH